ncbi:hypothetical protein CLF_103342 [Clonorchis sinensis]|uniref:Uncharacterized protein n=1 Tax=Clonorchis sinensis TaxID=79923 RepID=G7Y9K4_CLOSI|nr:hypothetical protein CLF_103342 [Clonorchis sinensis]
MSITSLLTSVFCVKPGDRQLLLRISLFDRCICVSETSIQNLSSITHLKPLDTNPDFSHFTFRVHGGPDSMARRSYGVRVVLSCRAGCTPPDWIPVEQKGDLTLVWASLAVLHVLWFVKHMIMGTESSASEPRQTVRSTDPIFGIHHR